jgi:hypothetical protein
VATKIRPNPWHEATGSQPNPKTVERTEGSILKRLILIMVMTLLLIDIGWAQVTRSTEGQEDTQHAPQQMSEPAHTAAGRGRAQEFENIVERQGPFSLGGRNFTVVMHYKGSPRGGGLDSRTIVSLDIRDAAEAVLYQQPFSYAVEGGTFSETCSAAVRLLRGSNGTGFLIESDCLPSTPLAGGPWQIVGIMGAKLVPFGKPLVTEGKWGEFVPGSVNRTGKLTQVLPDMLTLQVWTGYFFVSVPVRVDWREGKLALAQRCMYQTGHGFAEGGCEMPVDEARVARREQEMTFVRMFRESNEQSGPPAHIVVKMDSKVDVVAGKVDITWDEGPKAVSISVGEDVWVKVRIDGQEGWIHTPEDLNAVGMFASG